MIYSIKKNKKLNYLYNLCLKYKNIIILSVLCILIIVLIIRWKYNKYAIETFNTSQNLLSVTDTTDNNYLWSNKLYIEQYLPETIAENMIILTKPLDTASNTSIQKMIGTTIITDQSQLYNTKSLMVSREITPPDSVTEIFKLNDTSDIKDYSDFKTKSNLESLERRNNILIENLRNYGESITDIFNKVLEENYDNINVYTFSNNYNDSGANREEEVLIYDSNESKLSVNLDNLSNVNAVKIPIGSDVKILYSNGATDNFSFPINKIFRNNNSETNELSDIHEISYFEEDPSRMFNNSYNADMFNPFGKFGLGYMTNGSDWQMNNLNKFKINDKTFNHHYNYSTGWTLTNISDLSDSVLSGFLSSNVSSNVSSNDNINRDKDIYYYEIIRDSETLKFFISHIGDLDLYDENKEVDIKTNITRKVYGWSKCDGRDFVTIGYDKDRDRYDLYQFGEMHRCLKYEMRERNPNGIPNFYTTIGRGGTEEGAKKDKRTIDCCAEGLVGIDLVFNSYINDDNIGNSVITNVLTTNKYWGIRLWPALKRIRYNDNKEFQIKLIYHAKNHYINTFVDRATINATTGRIKITNIADNYVHLADRKGAENKTSYVRSNYDIDLLEDLIMKDINDFFDEDKRNLLACLWSDNKYVIENKLIVPDEFNLNRYAERIKKDFELSEDEFETKKINEPEFIIKWLMKNDPNAAFSYRKDSEFYILKDDYFLLKDNHKYSSYLEIQFVKPLHAKEFVANILNKIDYKLWEDGNVKKINYELIQREEVSSLESNLTTVTDTNDENIHTIRNNITEFLENYKDLVNMDENSNFITTINEYKEKIENELSQNTIKQGGTAIYYLNMMFRLPVVYYENDSWNLKQVTLKHAGLEPAPAVRSIEVSIKEENNPIYLTLKDNLRRIDTLINNIINFITETNIKHKQLLEKIDLQQLKHFPLSIYRPNPKSNYVSLGDVITSNNYEKVNKEDIACIPEKCALKVRDWLESDKVYQYDNNNQYLALFKNPYTNTFKAVTTRNMLPPDSVRKIVACVDPDPIIEEIKTSENCINKYKKLNNDLYVNNNLDQGKIMLDMQEREMKTLVDTRQEQIENLKAILNQIEDEDYKASIINSARNRAKFQELLDIQQVNIDRLTNNLYSIISINVNKEELLKLLRKNNIDEYIINRMISLIQNPPNKDAGAGLTADNNIADASISEPDKLQKLIYNIDDRNKQKLILRSLVESSCGCYFTDEEILRTR